MLIETEAGPLNWEGGDSAVTHTSTSPSLSRAEKTGCENVTMNTPSDCLCVCIYVVYKSSKNELENPNCKCAFSK